MSDVLETEVLQHCLSRVGEHATAVAASFEPEQLEALRARLAQLLLAEATSGHSLVTTRELQVSAPPNFKSVLYKSGRANMLVAFSFGDAATEAGLQILGLAIVLFTTGPSLLTTTQLGSVLKTLWSKLVVLKQPGDSEAIAVLEAMTRVRARHRTTNKDLYPTTQEIQSDANMSAECAKLAFTKLKSKGVIRVITWGAQEDDVTNAENRWAIKL
ncbi:hypothetical protein QTH97_32165 [Variovorax sp. J22R24]|uniref:hypothetical protein n=1 Tax=Variovorax gracilis TaxID=3053502 RepID=UPI002575A1A9|nr:hypothetical protein [Variovorax sp. J22R24]MDM0109615.1 hypothetical protein [Variovorax sp. J22R24]